MDRFLIVQYTDSRPRFMYATTLEAAIGQVDCWLATTNDTSVKAVVIVYVPNDQVVYHKRLNQPHFLDGLHIILRAISHRFTRSVSSSATYLELN